MAEPADPAMAATAVTTTYIDRDGALGGEGENKFQRVISAWRSTASQSLLEAPADVLQTSI